VSACETLAAAALSRSDAAPFELATLISRIEQGGIANQSGLASITGWTSRHVARLMRRQIGHTPAELMRIARFHRARSGVVRTTRSFAEIASSCGYFDQPHMIHDFQRFACTSPAQLRCDAGLYDVIYATV
jgi:transcriptional regulator GlxA family with amidase domain